MSKIIELKQLCDFCKNELTDSEKENKLQLSLTEVARCKKHFMGYYTYCPSCLRRKAYLIEHGLRADTDREYHYEYVK